MAPRRTLHPVLGILLLAPASAAGQVRASEIGVVSQVIDGTRLTIEASRPRARGRSPIFGKVVQWGEVWTPGANFATTFELNRAAKLDGHPVPAGKYSVWIVVRQSAPWTFVLDPDAHRYHMFPPDSSARQIRFDVTPGSAPFTETLTWSIPEVRVGGADVQLRWGTTLVSLRLEVEPSYALTMPAETAAQYAGRYDFRWTGPDSTKRLALVLTYERGMLMGSFEPRDEYFDRMAMIPVRTDWLTPGLFEKGELYEVVREYVFEFSRTDGRVTSFLIRGIDDEVAGRGTRQAATTPPPSRPSGDRSPPPSP